MSKTKSGQLYYDDSFGWRWNRIVLCMRKASRKWKPRHTIGLAIFMLLGPIFYLLLSSTGHLTSFLSVCGLKSTRLSKRVPLDDRSPFKERSITHAYDVSVRKPTSALWPGGCKNEPADKIEREQCISPRRKIMFVKTHKCASSTVSSAILRHALNTNSEVALPKYDLGHIGWPSPYRPYHVWGFSAAGFHDVLAHHIVYDRCYIQHDFPITKTIYATIIRHPYEQFKSAVNFFKEARKVLPKKEEAVIRFLTSPEYYEKDSKILYGRLFFGEISLTRNMMSTDLGFPSEQAQNQSSVDLFTERLDKDFDLIMIQEYFDQSLVLFKRLMCWQLKDLLYLTLNTNKSKKYRKDDEVTDAMLKRHREWSNVDYQMYDNFNKTFWEKVHKEGESFDREVTIFKHMLKEFNDFCNSTWMNGWVYPPNEFSKQFTMSREDCKKVSMMPWELTPTLWMVSNGRLILRNDNPFNKRELWTHQDVFEKWY